MRYVHTDVLANHPALFGFRQSVSVAVARARLALLGQHFVEQLWLMNSLPLSK
jgi:hypothetical protein